VYFPEQDGTFCTTIETILSVSGSLTRFAVENFVAGWKFGDECLTGHANISVDVKSALY